MTDPASIHHPPTEAIEVVIYDEPDQEELEGIDPLDFAPAEYEFSDFNAFCPELDDWAEVIREPGQDTWHCRYCGATDHPFRDHEGAGA